MNDFGVDISNMEDKPDTWIWGNSTKFNYDPIYDFDTFKLWSFLCAYYFDFTNSADKDEGTEATYWEYDKDEVGGTAKVIEDLFNTEYKFEYWYDNTSRWEELSPYNYYGGKFDNGYSYYKAEGPTKYWGNEHYDYSFKATNRPNEISEYLDDNGILYIKSKRRIQNCQS